MSDLLVAARDDYIARGWTPIPLGLDDQGYPKRPLPSNWQHTTLATAAEAPQWDYAVGLGLVLGPASQNLGIIDIDDEPLANAIFDRLEAGHVEHYLVETGRKRGHLYLYERVPGHSTRFKVPYQGREVGIELRVGGNQCAAPPTPGYTLLTPGRTPVSVESLAVAWAAIARVFGFAPPEARSFSSSGYPKPWAERVGEGERNNALYVEAHKLRDVGMSEAMAMDILLTRARIAFAAGEFSEEEARRTIRSAYRKSKQPAEWRFAISAEA